MFDNNPNYLWLVGKQTNVDQFTFNMKGIVTISNTIALNSILNNNNIDKSEMTKFGMYLNFPIINPSAILSLFF